MTSDLLSRRGVEQADAADLPALASPAAVIGADLCVESSRGSRVFVTTRRDNWRDIVTIYRQLPSVLRAQRDLKRAAALRSHGQYVEAFVIAVRAFGVLEQDAFISNPAAQALVATDTVLLDQLAREVGQPNAARQELADALRICTETLGPLRESG
jgi:hypothetical protein